MIGEKYTMHLVVIFLLALVALQTYDYRAAQEQSINQDNAHNQTLKELNHTQHVASFANTELNESLDLLEQTQNALIECHYKNETIDQIEQYKTELKSQAHFLTQCNAVLAEHGIIQVYK
jgi:hypothetical protein